MYEIGDNKYHLTDSELSVIQALCFFAPEDMTQRADKVREELLDYLNNHRYKRIDVWKGH